MSPTAVTIILYTLTVPVAVIVFLVWFIKKMNRIDNSLQEILSQMRKDHNNT